MSDCEFCSGEGFCIAESEAGFKCSLAKGKWKECTAKPEDLVDCCANCDIKPATNEGIHGELCEECAKELEIEIAAEKR